MISDFVMQTLDKNLIAKIDLEKEKNTAFYSLVIGNSGNTETMECFNHNWFYNMNDSKSSRHLVEQLHKIRIRESK